MKFEWWGGPLDGAVLHRESRQPVLPVWVGPDPVHPQILVVCYEAEKPKKDSMRYVYSQELTNKANEGKII